MEQRRCLECTVNTLLPEGHMCPHRLCRRNTYPCFNLLKLLLSTVSFSNERLKFKHGYIISNLRSYPYLRIGT